MTQAAAVSPEYVLLGLLHQQPAHGYALHERIMQEPGTIWPISLSWTYHLLIRLESQGYIAGMAQEKEKLPARRKFRLMSAGRRRFEDWLSAPTQPSARAIRVEFLTQLFFALAVSPAHTHISQPGNRSDLCRASLLNSLPGSGEKNGCAVQ
jgi:DNA-binding PadR family transcriptional regulator